MEQSQQALQPEPVAEAGVTPHEVMETLRARGVKVIIYFDDNKGLFAIEYPAEGLSLDEASAAVAHIIFDTLGPEPQMSDLLKLQQSMMKFGQ